MSTHKAIDRICIFITVFSLLLTVLFMNGEAFGITKIVDEDAEANADSAHFTANDQNGDWDTAGATVITLSGETANVSGGGAYAYDGGVVITGAGHYVLSGTLTDGSVTVDTNEAAKVWLLFDGVDIACSDDACLRVNEADKVFLTLAPGSENALTSGAAYSEAALADGTDGTIFAHDDLTINGSGSLTVTAAYRHGIAANDDLVITGGTIAVTAPQDAIHANDSIRIREASITAAAGDDGVAVSNEGGYLYLESGALTVEAGDDGIHAAGDITIAGGTVTVAAGDDGVHSDTAVTITGGVVSIPSCYEGIEAPQIELSGGDVTICPTDDGLNANGGSGMFGMGGGFGGMGMSGRMQGDRAGADTAGVTGVRSGIRRLFRLEGVTELYDALDTLGFTESIPSDPDDLVAWLQSLLDDGTLSPEYTATVQTIAEAIENGAVFTGDLPLQQPADAQAAAPSQPAQQGASAEEGSGSETPTVRISGGTLTILNSSGRDADGIDSNGDLIITGGTIRVSLAGSGSNNAIDYGSESGGTALISGGTVVACGGSSMAENFDSASEQPSILYTVNATKDGETVSLKDAQGKILLTWEVPYGFTSVVMSCPELQVGETYTIAVGDTEEEITLASAASSYGSAQGGMDRTGGFGRTDASESGGAQAEGAARQGGFGGMGGRGFGSRGAASAENAPEIASGERPAAFGESGETASMPAPPDKDGAAQGEQTGRAAAAQTAQAGAAEETAGFAQAPLLLGVSAAVLLAGLGIAARTKGTLL